MTSKGSDAITTRNSAAFRELTIDQWIGLLIICSLAALIWIAAAAPYVVAGVYLIVAAWRLLLVLASRGRVDDAHLTIETWPAYAVLVALYREAGLVPQIIERLAVLDYPADKLSGFIVLEEDDHSTRHAVEACSLPSWLEVLIVPRGEPQTKPRALAFALDRVEADLITVYDAEDLPHVGQLKAAARRFAQDQMGRLACLQAPLRIEIQRAAQPSAFLDGQFAAEYAALFEVILPGMTRLGLPFPLGGTSNHFRTDALKAVGGWDPFNVTEDADLGFRLWRQGWRLGVFDVPTSETPPGSLSRWTPQRARWLKGYMQTIGVHTRRVWRLGARGLMALVMTCGAAVASAAIHAASLAWLAWTVALALIWRNADALASLPFALSIFAIGTLAAWITCAVGARRAGVRYGWLQMLAAPVYWCLSSLAFVLAASRLIRDPFHWDKTPHEPDPATPLDEPTSVRLSADHVAAPQPVT